MDKVFLKSALKKLRALPLDVKVHANVMMAPQEMLDFLAVMEGVKPVYLLGRGFDDAKWIAGARELAVKMNYYVVEGSQWDAQAAVAGVDPWFYSFTAEKWSQTAKVFYICKTPNAAAGVKATFDKGVSMEDEARLLGYPLCCVCDHYRRHAAMVKLFFKMMTRSAQGNVDLMKKMILEDTQVSVEGAEEETLLKEAHEFHVAPFTSFHMCAPCRDHDDSPAKKVSAVYKALAMKVDPVLAQTVEANAEGAGSYS